MRKVIVTTTINPPTEAVRRFDKMEGWTLLVIGDLKTPGSYRLENGTYLSPEEQDKFAPKLSEAIGWNCIQRRNIGFLWALDQGADLIATVDDDNIPYEGWGTNLLLDRKVQGFLYEIDQPAFDPVGATSYRALWHRGFPVQLLNERVYSRKRQTTLEGASVEAGFWDGDPDVDAICRMEYAPSCKFDPADFPFMSNKISPFNSQNTFLKASMLQDYFVFPGVGRQDDIWGSFYAQAMGHKVIYNKASVYQERNQHDLTKDLEREYVGYSNNLKLVERLSTDPQAILDFLPESSARAFSLYSKYFQ